MVHQRYLSVTHIFDRLRGRTLKIGSRRIWRLTGLFSMKFKTVEYFEIKKHETDLTELSDIG